MIPVPVRRYARYIAFHYLKNYSILLLGLSLAIVAIDFLQNAHRLDVGVNKKVAYAFYTWEYMLVLIYPLTILLAMAWTQVNFIRRNVFVALYSFGYSRVEIFRPFFLVALGIYLFFLGLQTGEFAYGQGKARAILKHAESQQKVNDLFFKYNGDFVYVRELDPVAKILRGVILFRIRKGKIDATIQIPVARYRDGRWIAEEAKVRQKRYDAEGKAVGFTESVRRGLSLLEGYRPKVVKMIYEGRSLTLIDGLRAWKLLRDQGLDTSKIRATLFNMVFMPLFALALLPILFFMTGSYQRFMRLERIWIVDLGSSLLLWAFFFAMYRLGISGTVDPYFGQLLPVSLLVFCAILFYLRERREG
ncbi:LptF/LptG family permease [Nitratifractor sp.]